MWDVIPHRKLLKKMTTLIYGIWNKAEQDMEKILELRYNTRPEKRKSK